MGVEFGVSQIRYLECPVGGRSSTNQRRFAVNRDGAQLLQKGRAAAGSGADAERIA